MPLADLEAEEYASGTGLWTRGLLVRRNPADGDRASFTTWCPAGTPLQTLVAVERQRWTIEDSFETAKTELGLDHNATRSWHGWHRHVSLVMLALPCWRRSVTLRKRRRPKNQAADGMDDPDLIDWSVQEIRRLPTRLAQRRIQPAHIIAWLLWRRAHQAAAKRSHLNRKMQL